MTEIEYLLGQGLRRWDTGHVSDEEYLNSLEYLNRNKKRTKYGYDDQLIYVMENELGLVKLGISNDPHKRRLNVQSSSGFETHLVTTRKIPEELTAYHLEQLLHCHLSGFRKKGEWFGCGKDVVIELLDKYLDCYSNPTNVFYNCVPNVTECRTFVEDSDVYFVDRMVSKFCCNLNFKGMSELDFERYLIEFNLLLGNNFERKLLPHFMQQAYLKYLKEN